VKREAMERPQATTHLPVYRSPFAVQELYLVARMRRGQFFICVYPIHLWIEDRLSSLERGFEAGLSPTGRPAAHPRMRCRSAKIDGESS
jgi:hypothetical protein